MLAVVPVACSPAGKKAGDAGQASSGGSSQAGAVQETGSIRAAEPVIFAIAGRTMALTLLPADGEAGSVGPWMPTRAPEVTFMTGEPLDSEVHWVWGRAPAPSEPPGWLPPTYSWRSLSLDEVAAVRSSAMDDPLASPGFWVLTVEVPERANGRELRMDGRPLPVTWLAEPPSSTDTGRAPRPRATAGAVRALGEMLRAEEMDPLRRWRVRLILDRWSAERLWDDPSLPATLEPPVLEVLAAQNEWRWRAALAALARSSPDAAADVLARLTALVLTPGGALLPAWPLDEAPALNLRNALLRRGISDEDRLNEAQAWIASTTPALAWVIDDGPLVREPGGSGRAASAMRRVRIGVADLTGRGGRASVTPEGQQPRESLAIESHESAVLNVETVVGSRIVDVLSVSTGRWNGKVAFRAAALPASPPGLALGPLYPMWSMPGWMAGNPGGVPVDWSTAGLLQRSAAGDGWEVYIECRVGEFAGERGADVVRLWWGAAGAGERFVEIEGPAIGEFEGDRWSATVPVPPRAINSDGSVLLALERIDARGARSFWPRPILPGEAEPIRALIDLTAWGEQSEADLPDGR